MGEKQLSSGSKKKQPRPWMAQEGWRALRNALLVMKFTNGFRAGRKLSDEPSFLQMKSFLEMKRKRFCKEPRNQERNVYF